MRSLEANGGVALSLMSRFAAFLVMRRVGLSPDVCEMETQLLGWQGEWDRLVTNNCSCKKTLPNYSECHLFQVKGVDLYYTLKSVPSRSYRTGPAAFKT